MLTLDPDKLDRIKRYNIIRPIGEGGMGRVYLATDKIIRRPVAIKLYALDEIGGSEAARTKIMRDFFLETQTAGALLHPNIVVIYDVGKKSDLLYMVMEFVYGKTLLEHHRDGRIPIKRCLEIVYELALALDYAHSQNVVHRDIKPENIILSAQGVPKITDFGIARFRTHLKEKAQSIVGSARFMAPEQVLRKKQDHRVDIYQLGVVLYELLTRRSPFRGSNPEETLSKVCKEIPPPVSTYNSDIPKNVERIVTRCIRKKPENRFANARIVAEELGACLSAGIHTVIAPDKDMVGRLRKFEMFSLFSEDEIAEIIKTGKFVSCSAGKHIISENESDSNFFVLLEGNVKVVKRSRVLTDFLPGACFGAIGAFARQKRSAAVIAVDDCKLVQINALLFQKLDPRLQLKMLNIVVRDMATLVMSLDDKITALTEGTEKRSEPYTVCPLCGYDNKAPIEVCPRCGVIPSRYSDVRDTAGRPGSEAATAVADEDEVIGSHDPTVTMDQALLPETEDSVWHDTADITLPDGGVEVTSPEDTAESSDD